MRIINLIPSFIKPILRLFRTKGMRLYRKWTFHPKSRDELHQYWKQPWDNMNLPQGYLKHEARSLFLVDITKKYASSSASTILEIGCNVGRNLEYLYRFGFRQLSGIEISESALQLLRQSYPDMSSCATIYNSPVENVIRDFNDGQFDIVFTMAVLEHIHPESEWVFPEIARITQKHIITIENEKNFYWRSFPRKYKKVFESLGMQEIEAIKCSNKMDLDDTYFARVFMKKRCCE